ncbi:copper homeostasis protein CutC [Vibrio sp. WXL103]|uniref:copper homeostasis protein CutC n=1 Tax=Vibrio sp. WXL103 TaxID=3450710 RepID=UPI003EC87541
MSQPTNSPSSRTPIEIEVCIDHIESLRYAILGGASRIELCSSLALGGLTPSFGLMRQAVRLSNVPIYVMIRPRQGDFLYTEEDIALMMMDIEAAASAGARGIVTGVLFADGSINLPAMKALVSKAHHLGLKVTFHRAIDQCRDAKLALEQLVELGCERVLTSGQASNALSGKELLKDLVSQANGRIQVMAGAGVNRDNVAELVNYSGVEAVHLSGKTQRASQMRFIANQAKMGAQDVDDFSLPVTNSSAIDAVKSALERR